MLTIATALNTAYPGNLVNCRLPNGNLVQARAANTILSAQILVYRDENTGQYWAHGQTTQTPILTNTRTTRHRPKPKKEEFYPFKTLSLWENGQIFKGGDNKQQLITNSNNIQLKGLTNLGKATNKFYAAWIKDNEIQIFENNSLNSYNPTYWAFLNWYGGDYFGLLFSRFLQPNTKGLITTNNETTLPNNPYRTATYSYTKTLDKKGDNYEYHYNFTINSNAAFSPLEITAPTDESAFITISFRSSGINVSNLTETILSSDNYIFRTGKIQAIEEYPILAHYESNKAITETISGNNESEALIGYNNVQHIFPVPFSGNDIPDTQLFNHTYQLSENQNSSFVLDSGEIDVHVSPEIKTKANYFSSIITTSQETISSDPNPVLVPDNITYGDTYIYLQCYPLWNATKTENKITREKNIYFYFKGIGSLAIYSKTNASVVISKNEITEGTLKYRTTGFRPITYPYHSNSYYTIPLITVENLGEIKYPIYFETIDINAVVSNKHLNRLSFIVRDAENNSIQHSFNSFHLVKDYSNTVTTEYNFSHKSWANYDKSIDTLLITDGEEEYSVNLENTFLLDIINPFDLTLTTNFPQTVQISIDNINSNYQTINLIGKDRTSNILSIPKKIKNTTHVTCSDSFVLSNNSWSNNQGQITNTNETLESFNTPSAIWQNIKDDCPIYFVRKEANIIYCYEGFASFTYEDTEVEADDFIAFNPPIYKTTRKISQITLTLTSVKTEKHFCLLDFYTASSHGFLFSRNNCLNVIRHYLEKNYNRVNFYKGKGIRFALGAPVEDPQKRETKHYADIYKFDNGNFIRQKNEQGSLSKISTDSNPLNWELISYCLVAKHTKSTKPNPLKPLETKD